MIKLGFTEDNLRIGTKKRPDITTHQPMLFTETQLRRQADKDRLHHALQNFIMQLQDKILFIFKIKVNSPRRYSGPIRQLLHGKPVKASRSQKAECRLENSNAFIDWSCGSFAHVGIGKMNNYSFYRYPSAR